MAQQRTARRALQWSLVAALVVVGAGAAGWWWVAGRRAEGGPADRAARPQPGQVAGNRTEAVAEPGGRELLRLSTQAGVRAVPVRRMTIRRYVEATGTVTAVRDVSLSFGVAGRLKAVQVVEGDRVKAGQVLAALEDTSQQLAYVRARNEYEQARLELGPAQVEESRLAMEAARRELESTKLVAPFDGVVVSVGVKAGEMVGASQPVVRLVDLSSLQVEVAVDEVDLPHVRPGQSALVSVKGYPDLQIRGTVERLTPAGRTQGDLVLFDVVVALREARPELLPGMTATARIEVERADNVLAVPEEAVVEVGGRSMVSRVVGDRAVLTPVELGVSDGRFVEVRAGLDEGDQVLATNYEVYRRLSGNGTTSGGAGPAPRPFFRFTPGPGPGPRGAGRP